MKAVNSNVGRRDAIGVFQGLEICGQELPPLTLNSSVRDSARTLVSQATELTLILGVYEQYLVRGINRMDGMSIRLLFQGHDPVEVFRFYRGCIDKQYQRMHPDQMLLVHWDFGCAIWIGRLYGNPVQPCEK